MTFEHFLSEFFLDECVNHCILVSSFLKYCDKMKKVRVFGLMSYQPLMVI